MSKHIQDKDTGNWYQRWPYHGGYIVAKYGPHGRTISESDYVGALVRHGRLWTVVRGAGEEREGTYKTLTEATDALISKHARKAVAA